MARDKFSLYIVAPGIYCSEFRHCSNCRYVENNKEHWHHSPMVIVKDVEDMNKVNLSVWLVHRMNFQNTAERWSRRALLVEEMIRVFKELDIEYRMLALDVNVRNMPAFTSTRLPSNWTACAN